MNEELDKLVSLMRNARHVVVFTGAGISTESGIPDFRGPGGVWEKFDPNEFHIDRFLASAASRRMYWLRSEAMYAQMTQARPNAGHKAIADMERLGILSAVITQNVDGLHQDAGVSPGRVVELHGTARHVACLSCGRRMTREEFQPLLSPEGDAPPCTCGGLMKPATISFGQMLPPEALERAGAATADCDLFLVIGSSLVVYPAAGFPLLAVERGAPLAIINHQETPQDAVATVVLRGSSGQVLPTVVGALAPGVQAAPFSRPT
ncbi:MAG: Sir2 family NAD-dependent protein deacetylase [Candidatus Lambdaproteobacteria bacterium]|nr:Sir2 family NAD-dependent protein deacetylase [Candidatus Lambdaproteobacteria bacterium]